MSTRPPMIPTDVLVIQLAYFLIIFLLSLSIYLQTRKLHNFAPHRGIKYFQIAFLAFALLYLCRFIVSIIEASPAIFSGDLEVMPSQIGTFFVAFLTVFGILSLLSSFLWKTQRWISDNKVALASLVLGAVIYFFRVPEILFAISLITIAILVIALFNRYKSKKKVFSSIYIVYSLLMVFFLLDLVPLIQQITPPSVEITGYIGVIAIFVYLNIKLKKVFSSGEKEEKPS
jgi:hypothetical protein